MTELSFPHDENSKKEVTALRVNEVGALKKALEEERVKVNDYFNRLKYLQADFENYKKRADKEVKEIRQYGNRRLILELLTILDELEYAINAGKQGSSGLLEGVEIILNKLHKVLEREGLSKIATVGQAFDPNKHEAVLKVHKKNNDGIILEEVRKGFMLKNIVLRPSLVKVAVDKSRKAKEDE